MNMHLPALPRADKPWKQLAVVILKVAFVLCVVALVAASIEQQRQQRELEKAQHAAHRAQVSSAKAQSSLALAQRGISHFAHLICTNQFEAFSAVDSLVDHGIQVTQQRLAADIAAGRTRNVTIDRRSIASSKVLRAKFAPLDC